jgi:hypothetical protein
MAFRRLREIRRVAFLSLVVFAAALSPARAGAPFVTDDPEPVEYGHWEISIFSQGTHVSGERSGTLAGIDMNYGALPELQLHLIAPLAYDKISGSSTKYGYGNTELGVKYRLIQESDDGLWPAVAVFPIITVPTGDDKRGLGNGRTRTFLPLWLEKSFGDWRTFGGGGYWNNPGADNKDYWFAGWALQRQIAENLSLGGELFHQTADTVDGKSSTGFNLGAIYDLTENYHLLFSAGRGVQNASSTNRFSYYVSFQWTF